MLNYEEQAIIKMYEFNSKKDLKGKLEQALLLTEDLMTKETIQGIINKLPSISFEELINSINIFDET